MKCCKNQLYIYMLQ
uniref:Uncharacterized protein n=1 Tax=Rhizophora mucronata TaxID=61149 RepID=A0A2P2NQP0_RHIMU